MKKLIIIISMLFSVAYGQTCDTVTNLTFSLVTTSTARVTWTHATNKITYNWALYCLSGCGGIAQQSGNTAGNTLNLSGLNSSFAYQFCITTYCGATSSTPKCSNFTTLSPQIQYTPMTAAGYQFKYVKVDTGFNIPFQDTSLKRGTTRPGALVCNTADSNVYSYNGNYWELLQGVNSAANKVDSVIINSAGDSLFYWINGTSYGQVFGGASSRWSILGNSGTVAGTNFIGTTDSVRLDLRTNNTIRQSITGSGNVGIGTVTPSSKLHVYTDANNYSKLGGSIQQIVANDSVLISGDNKVHIVSDAITLNATDNATYIPYGFNAGTSNSISGYLTIGSDLNFNLESFPNKVGLGTTTPQSKLHVAGTIRGTDSLILSGLASGIPTGAKRLLIGSNGSVYAADTTAGGGGATIDTANKWVNTITRTAGKDSIIFYIGTTRYAIKDSVGGAGSSQWTTDGGSIYYTGRVAMGTSTTSSTVGLIVKGVGSGYDNVAEFRNSSNTLLSRVREDGYLLATTIIDDQQKASLNSAGVAVGGASIIGFSNNIYAWETLDAGISRLAAGKLAIGNGSTGDYSGTLIAGAIGIGTTTPTAVVHIKAGTTAASSAPLKFTTGTNLTTAEAGAMEYTTPQLFFTNGGLKRQEIFMGQQVRTTSQFDKTSDNTLSNITGLTADLVAGKTYRFEATCYTTSSISGGVKFSIAGTATATTFIAGSVDALNNYPATRIITTMGSTIADQTTTSSGTVIITGTITVNTAGTLTVQFAQNASNGTASSVLAGSTLVVTEML